MVLTPTFPAKRVSGTAGLGWYPAFAGEIELKLPRGLQASSAIGATCPSRMRKAPKSGCVLAVR